MALGRPRYHGAFRHRHFIVFGWPNHPRGLDGTLRLKWIIAAGVNTAAATRP
ncbi:MAG: hypothetical protein ACJ8M1_05345 [Chthoniobacterales bacterium]